MNSIRQIFVLTLAILLCCIFTNCKKVPLPDPSVKSLFGHWKLISTSVRVGEPIWPTDKEIWVEFKETGKYKKHEKGKLVKTEKFK